MASFSSPLLIVGSGPGALVAAKVASAAGLASILTSDAASPPQGSSLEPTELDERSIAILEPDGVLGVLRPYAASQDPFAIAPALFCDGLKHHCVADMIITVFDGMTLAETERPHDGRGDVAAVLDDGRRSWSVEGDAFLDARAEPADLNQAIAFGAAFSRSLLERLLADQSDLPGSTV